MTFSIGTLLHMSVLRTVIEEEKLLLIPNNRASAWADLNRSRCLTRALVWGEDRGVERELVQNNVNKDTNTTLHARVLYTTILVTQDLAVLWQL
jgi:hypothetical protein